MERLIKFRAKDRKGNWNYGYYHYGVMYPNDRANHYIDNEIIDVTTLGQFIGFNDGGFPVYEGDITNTPTRTKYVISWNQEKCLFAQHFKNTFLCEFTLSSYPIELDRIEIIGNIHDNPELLK